jgi:hypothetical protein
MPSEITKSRKNGVSASKPASLSVAPPTVDFLTLGGAMEIEIGTVATMEEGFFDLIPVVITDFSEVDGEIVSVTVREDNEIPGRNPRAEHTFELDRETGLYASWFSRLFAVGEQHTFLAADEL